MGNVKYVQYQNINHEILPPLSAGFGVTACIQVI